ncbi:MAG: cadherin domain-containing protein, partial [Pirellulaceae bacterium]
MRSLEVLESRCLLAVTLSGRVFEDGNGNQQWETGGPAGERPLACWEVFLDLNLDGARQPTEPAARTGSDGMYRFEGLEAGTYRLELAAGPGFDRTTPVRFAESTSLVATVAQDQVLDPVRNVLYVTSGDRILRRDPLTGATLATLAIGQSLSGIDVTPDGRYLIVGDAVLDGGSQTGRLHRIDLTDNSVISIPFSVASADERGVFDVVAVSNTRALFTTRSLSNGAVPLREADLPSGTAAERNDVLSLGPGRVHPASRLDRNAAGQAIVLVDAGDAAGRVYRFDPQTNAFADPVSLHAQLDDAHVAISRDGQRVAIEAASLGLKVLDPQGNVVHSLPHLRGGVAFDTHRDILYAGDTTSNELVAFRVTDWSELYRTPLGEDVPESGNYFEMHVGSRARVLTVSTPAGVRYFRLDQPAPHFVNAAADSVFSLLDFGVWWNGQNRRPEGAADAYLVDEDTERQVGGAGVLANDSDPDGDALTAAMAYPPQHGTVDVHSDGTFVYRPAENYFGSDTFTYTVHDPVLAAACRTTVTLQVAPVNDAPEAIALDHASVSENSVAAVIGLVTVTDPDVGDQHVLTVSDTRFEVVNGMLKLRSLQSLDHESAAVIPITITATDNGTPARHFSRDFTIVVEDVNEFDPDIQTTTIEVAEGSTTVGSVLVQDGDTSQSILISILGGSGQGVFSIDPQTGRIVVAGGQTLDHEGTRAYVLTLQATDNVQPPRTTTKDLTITVLDVNEANPQVNPAAFTLAEDAPAGAIVGSVSAQDADTLQSLHYAITAGNPGSAFAVDGVTGE